MEFEWTSRKQVLSSYNLIMVIAKKPFVDDESLCVVPTRTQRGKPVKAIWTNAIIALCAFVCGLVVNARFNPSLRSVHGVSLDREHVDMGLAVEVLPFDVHDENERHLSEILGQTNCSIPEEAEEDDDDADVEASEVDEVNWFEDLDTIVEEDELDADEENEGLLDHNETLEESETDLEGLDYNLTVDATSRRLDGNTPKIESLACNADLENKPCTPLSNSLSADGIIPCGTCYEVDATGGEVLDFPNGLVVKGKLFFPSSSNVTIRSKFIFVRGILKIVPPSSGNQIKFSLYQEEQVSFVNEDSTGVCGSGNGCSLGSKVIAVVGGQLDIQGYDPACPTWEKLRAVGQPFPQAFVQPTDEAGTPMDLEIAGVCHESPGHTNALGKYTVWCPITKTVTVRHGTSKALVLTSGEPRDPKPFVAPKNNGQEMSLKLEQGCRVSWDHTRWAKKCMIYCPVEKTATIRYGAKMPLKFTSVKPPPRNFAPPKQGSQELALKIRQRCHESRGHTNALKKYTVRCPLERTATVRYGTGMSLKITNPVTGDSFTAMGGVHHWAWGGRNMYFFPDITDEEVSTLFPPGSTMQVEYIYKPGGQVMNVRAVHHWAWAGRYTFFYPDGYTTDDCGQAALDFNDAFPVGYGIDVSFRKAVPVPAGQQITATNGVHHWAWHGDKLFFHPDVSVGEVNRLFPPGYVMQVSYSDHTHVNELKLSPEAASCWGPGTELVLTSHTRRPEDRQTAVVTSVDTTTGTVTLNNAIETPISMEDHPDFAVEIASLNRPVVFEAESDTDNSLIGGHLIVFKTETKQHIEGVHIRNFGQQGKLGRYPIHFHMCGTTSNSVVKRNIVYESNQRGYVLHCSDNVLVEENIAFKVPGHCYFLEAGTETGANFTRNLGIGVTNMPAGGVAQLSAQSGRQESDDATSVFWISNPNNYFVGNVAAGSERHGYWFETRTWANRKASVGAFVDNEAHSCRHFAFTTYPPGWRPDAINFITNIKIYRNSGWGAFLHVTKNLVFEGGIFADNGNRAIMMNRGDDVVFEGTVFIGQSPWAEKKSSNCREGPIGIALNPARLGDLDYSGTIRGTSLIGAKFYNWTEEATGCPRSRPVQFRTEQVFTKAFNAPHTFKNVFIDDNAHSSKLDACKMENELGIEDSIIRIVDDVNNTFSPEGVPGFLASAKVTTMLPDGSCSYYNECLLFCPNTCLRTVSVLTNAAQPSGTRMLITDTSSLKTIEVQGSTRSGQTQISWMHATFTAALPQGSFEISFVDANNQLVWPSYAIPVLEAAPMCSHITINDLTFVKPPPSCDELVQNGDFASGIQWWQGHKTNNIFDPSRGVDSSGALLTTGDSGSGVSQWLNVNCLVSGVTYDVSAFFRQVDAYGATVAGCTTSQDCPRLAMEFKTFVPSTGSFPTSWATIATTDVTSYTNDNSFDTISGQWVVTNEQASADMARLVILDAADQLIVDNVSIKKVT
ncbi:G8 domain-containing protein DDB [Seminavis robusta]|uniref:G8 domain-containing protein DDB n=1 Tax=Seminavis robusta TaxID=568900 RepID=A0A9N8E7F6_9STRA|nr:G8 domain-containing protein DDB [Seminavis robusta]|eukprot:Sro576_g169550.1 G8 domain-containing protein DDB (1464) ;mRNA; f:45069-50230